MDNDDVSSSVEYRIDQETLCQLRSAVRTSRNLYEKDLHTIGKHAFGQKGSPLMRSGGRFLDSIAKRTDISSQYDSAIGRISNVIDF